MQNTQKAFCYSCLYWVYAISVTQKALAVASDEAAVDVFVSSLKSCVHAWGRSRWELNIEA